MLTRTSEYDSLEALMSTRRRTTHSLQVVFSSAHSLTLRIRIFHDCQWWASVTVTKYLVQFHTEYFQRDIVQSEANTYGVMKRKIPSNLL